jgi:cysteine desulfurase
VEELGADAYSISAHKMRGPQGIGALQVRKGVPFEPIFPGGHQERGLRPGTENLLAIVGMGAAAKLAASERQDFADTVGPLRDSLGTMLRARVPDMRLNGRGDRLANTLNVAVPGCPGDALLQAMDLAGVAASSGSACTSGTVEPSHVLLAMGQVHEEAREAVRFTLARETTPHAMNRVVEVFCESVDRIRQADVLLEDWGKVG